MELQPTNSNKIYVSGVACSSMGAQKQQLCRTSHLALHISLHDSNLRVPCQQGSVTSDTCTAWRQQLASAFEKPISKRISLMSRILLSRKQDASTAPLTCWVHFRKTQILSV
jgi:hypothetical protein